MIDLGVFDGRNYRPYCSPDPCPTLPQAILAALALALFVVGGLLLAVAATGGI